MQATLLVICGPTAVGKTALSIALAKQFTTEIISADSRQVYREMQIGTARPFDAELESVPHHLLGHISIHQKYTVADFAIEANELISKIHAKNPLAILVGGSGLYLDAVCNGLDDLPNSDASIKANLLKTLESEGIEKLQKQLLELDPVYFHSMDINNPHRLIRAIEVCLISGKKFSDLRLGKKMEHPFRIVKIGLQMERKKLYEKINLRVEHMFEQGLLEEVKGLLPYKNLKALKTVGYSELFDFLDAKISIEQALLLIQQNTRRYAKRQMTWFRRDQEINWFEVLENNAELINKVKALL
ncbi:MAG: tRNA (adenosine(37)-N6)-dimethylallyltransferase MiaA [Bacteroidetes bacterium]|nr:tRNA (adenosine(37)-N6)-dimethylallyltransferase MiaA [Bacteroidota bacterium]